MSEQRKIWISKELYQKLDETAEKKALTVEEYVDLLLRDIIDEKSSKN
jgi:hypothetical protein